MERIVMLLGAILILVHHSNALSKFDPQFIDQFLTGCGAKLNLSKPCAQSIEKIRWFLNAYDTLPQQWSLFYTAYGNGQLEFMNDNRWQFNMMACFESAAETQYSRSEYPMSYCIGTTGSRKDTFGICIPRRCSQHSDAFQILQEWMSESAMNQSYLRLLGEDIECLHSRKKRQWTEQWDVITELTINMLSILVVSSSTIFHLSRGRSRYSNSLLSRIYLSFAVSNNYQKLFTISRSRQNTIECLVGLRVLSMIWVIVAHTICLIQLHLSNVNDLRKDISTSFFDQWITNPTLSVTSFFVISATVSSYGWFLKWNVAEEQERRQIYTVKYWLKFYIHRMIRLLPAYFYTLITVTYKSTNHSYSSAWPQTDPYVQCRKHWLEHLLLLNCFGKATCLGWTWYVSAEFFCYLASPIFLITLAINSWIGIAVSIFTIGCSSVYAAFLIFRDNLPPVPLIWSIQYGYDIEYYHVRSLTI